MKNSIAITLHQLHTGSGRQVVTLEIDGHNPAEKFLTKLKKKDSQGYDSLLTRIRTVAEYEFYENTQTFRPLGNGLYEFKRNTPKLIRFYAFYHMLDGVGQLILCTNGGDKRRQEDDIKTAREIQEFYLQAINQENTIITYEEPEA